MQTKKLSFDLHFAIRQRYNPSNRPLWGPVFSSWKDRQQEIPITAIKEQSVKRKNF
jgi:hypothetical protein